MDRRPTLGRDLLAGAAGGIAGTLVSGVMDRALSNVIGSRTKIRRRKSAHDVAADRFTRRLFGRSEPAWKVGHVAFGALYGAGWGLLYAGLRRGAPRVGAALGLPFAIPFFLACDGAIAPLVGLAPRLTKIPWPLDAKELAGHVAWTATTELVERAARRFLWRGA